MNLQALDTPCLVLDARKMERNVARLRERLRSLRVPLRFHVKTAKCWEVVRPVLEKPDGPITVSTLKEAESFFARGVKDILYAVGIGPGKLGQVTGLRRRGADLSILLDSLDAAAIVATHAKKTNDRLPVLIEIDCDGHRAGIKPEDPTLLAIGALLAGGGCEVAGVLTHAGSSYACTTPEDLRAAAEQERRAVVEAAERLRQAGSPCPIVSVGSTPTAFFAESLEGVTEVRAGVFVFFDLVMAGLGVCSVDDVAVSVLSTVIGHQEEKGWTLIDAGWMALSRDRGTASQRVDQGYGLVCDVDGTPYPGLIVRDANQEHGIVAHRHGDKAALPYLPLGSKVRILPNHACATAAQHGSYHVVRDGMEVEATWERFGGW